MLLARTKLGASRIEGVGLFSSEFIPAGALIWRFDPIVDLRLTFEQIAALAPPCREQVMKYSYREKQTGLYVLCGDDARFFNHADEPNRDDLCDDSGGVTIARRDIAAGEELTCDYRLFDLDLIEGKYSLAGFRS